MNAPTPIWERPSSFGVATDDIYENGLDIAAPLAEDRLVPDTAWRPTTMLPDVLARAPEKVSERLEGNLRTTFVVCWPDAHHDPIGFERVTTFDPATQDPAMVGWSLRFDADVLNKAVDIHIAGLKDDKSVGVRSIETSMEWQVWNEADHMWEELQMNDFICGNLGLFLLIRRSNAVKCVGFERIKETINAVALHNTFYATALEFRKEPPLFSIS